MEELTKEMLQSTNSFGELLDKRYGVRGTPEREKFEAEIQRTLDSIEKSKKYKKPNPYYPSKRKFK